MQLTRASAAPLRASIFLDISADIFFFLYYSANELFPYTKKENYAIYFFFSCRGVEAAHR